MMEEVSKLNPSSVKETDQNLSEWWNQAKHYLCRSTMGIYYKTP
jgi:hypothetical protein